LRIISGSSRGRKLLSPAGNDNSIRPTSDRAREALFNILGRKVCDADVLDLFAGTGAVGLEAYSRSAARVVFIDFAQTAVDLITRNLERCLRQPEDRAKLHVIKHDLSQSFPAAKLQKLGYTAFDIIFVDPPYGKNFSLAVLNYLSKSSFTAATTKIVLEERHDIVLPQQIGRLTLTDKRRYGEAAFWFYASETTQAP
jgi:16S rRNA (guanine966-N2)-methyltransferase